MSKKLVQLFTIILSLVLISCNSEMKQVSGSSRSQVELKNSNQEIQLNKSLVEAEVLDIFKSERADFILKVRVNSVKADNAYASIAVPGEEYTLVPSFVLNDKKEVDRSSDRNKRLLSLAELKPGDRFSAEIFLDKTKGWFISDLLK